MEDKEDGSRYGMSVRQEIAGAETVAQTEHSGRRERSGRTQEHAAFKMPVGALIACFIVIALLVAGVTASVMYIANNFERIEQRIAAEATGSARDSARTVDETEAPEATALPGSVDAPDSLHYTSNPIAGADEYTIIENCMEAVVSIDVMVRSGYSTVPASSGSGVIITEDGYIVTCNHVIENADKIYVYLNDGTSKEAKLVGTDVINDLAVIKIDGTSFHYAAIGDSDSLRVGEGVFAIGNALGELSNTYTSGAISGLDRVLKVEGQEMTLLQTDAAVNHGNSGGGLFRKSDGSLIGIVNAKSSGSDIDGLGFAIPVKVVQSVVKDLIDFGFVSGRPYLGVTTEDVALSGYGFFTSYYTYPRIIEIEENSPAALSGLQVGDTILSIDGISVSGSYSLQRTLNSYSIGDTVTVTVLRNRSSVDYRITLGERTLPEA